MKNRLGGRIAASAIVLGSLGLAGTAVVATATPAYACEHGTCGEGGLDTDLVAAPVSVVGSLLQVSVTFSATLTSINTGNGIPGQSVVFSWNGGTCTGTTNANGVGTCTANVLNIVGLTLQPTYSATYAGLGDYENSSATGTVTLL
jgi:hypothetical protein